MRISSIIKDINESSINRAERLKKADKAELNADLKEKIVDESITSVNKSVNDSSESIDRTQAQEKLKEIKEQFISDKKNLKVMDAISNIKDKVVSTLIE